MLVENKYTKIKEAPEERHVNSLVKKYSEPRFAGLEGFAGFCVEFIR